MMPMMAQRDPLLPAQLLGMVAVIGIEALAQAQLPAATPLFNRAAAWGIVAALMLFWLWVVPRRLALLVADEDRRADTLMFAVLWFGSFGVVGQIFLLFPWLGQAAQLLVILFSLGTVAVLALTAVERPPATGTPALMLLVIPSGLVAWHLMNPVPLRWGIIFVTAVFAGLFWLLHGVVQQLVNRSHAAMLDADAARAEAIAAREAKTRFLAAAWHDLGQPVQAARLYVDQALRSPDERRRAHAAKGAETAFASVETQLRAMLEHLRLESGVVEAARERVALALLIEEAVALASPAAKAAAMQVKASVGDVAVLADRALLLRAVGNLIDNCLRHSGGRTVAISAESGPERVTIRIADDGRGIAPAAQASLFEDFRQGERAARDGGFQPHGFGLGLASARRIARLLDGELRYDARHGPGACFVLEIPAA
jgi:signal transduction histidine kinase